jgi:hypothetical protein
MLKDTKQTHVQEQQDGSGGYASSLQTQQPSGSYDAGHGDGYQRYDQPPLPGSQPQQPQQPHGAPPCFDAGPYELISLGMRARTAGWLSYLYYKLPVIGDFADKLIDRIHL